MQLGGDEQCLQIITDISESGDNILDSISSDRMSIIQQQVPVIASFLAGCPEKIPDHLRQLLYDLVNMFKQTFSVPIAPDSDYGDPTESPCDVFPSLPKVHGNGLYEVDRKTKTDKNEQCRKDSWGHPTLSPGISRRNTPSKYWKHDFKLHQRWSFTTVHVNFTSTPY